MDTSADDPSAAHDAVTGLATRDVVVAGLEDGGARQLTLVAIDLDGFRWVNDHLGDDVGDAVLRAAAERLDRIAGSYRRGGALGAARLDVAEVVTVGRIGDDEFGLVVAGDPVQVALLVDVVLGAFRSPLVVELASVPLTVSIGIATSAAPEGATGHEIIQWASRASREAARLGGDRAVVYSLDMTPSHRARLAAEHLLRRR